VGWAAGIERILLAGDIEAGRARKVFVSWTIDAGTAFAVTRAVRARGAHAEQEQAGRSLKGQLKHADRIGAAYVVFVDEGLAVKDMSTGEQHSVASVEEAVEAVTK
jgi:histidyl-tRNA synthetase